MQGILPYIIRRLLWAPFVLFAVSFVAFVVTRLGPGDPISVAAGQFRDPAAFERVRASRGLDKPIVEQYGIYIKKGRAAGCFLPQVATETGWSKEEFLSYCCSHKAGLADDAWRDPQTEVYLFNAEVFGSPWTEI